MPASQITVSPFTLIAPELPRLKVGYMRAINKRWRWGVDVGIGHDPIAKKDQENYFLIEFRPEIFRIFRADKKTNWYFSSSIFYTYHTESFKSSSFDLKAIDYYVRYDKADLQRHKYGMHFKLGFIAPLGKRLSLNLAAGGGGRFRTNNFANIENPAIGINRDDDFHEYDRNLYKRKEGTYLGIDLIGDFRILYKL